MLIAPAEFDHLFAAIQAPDAGPPTRRGRAPAGDDRAEERLRLAVALFHRGDYARCASLLREVGGALAHDPQVVALRAASRGLTTGRVKEGIEACVQALRRAFYVPDLYCALGVLLLRSGDRARAFAAFQRGLRLEATHPGLAARVREMGVRRPPVLGFLRRAHPANRWLGRVRSSLLPRGRAPRG